MACLAFEFNNLGVVEKAQIELAGITILTGQNSTGKTYIANAIFSALNTFEDFPRQDLSLEEGEPSAPSSLHEYGQVELGAEKTRELLDQWIEAIKAAYNRDEMGTLVNFSFSESSTNHEVKLKLQQRVHGGDRALGDVTISFDRGVLKTRISNTSEKWESVWCDAMWLQSLKTLASLTLLPPTYFSTSERSGVAVFQKELDLGRSRRLERLQSGDYDTFRESFEASRLPLSLRSNLDMVRDAPDLVKGSSSAIARENPHIIDLLEEIVGARYSQKDNEIEVRVGSDGLEHTLELKQASSSIRALLDLSVFVQYVARPGHVLIIDEPELNLHPHNQVLLARLLVQLSNAGIRVLVSTHSDYFLREVGMCVMLSHPQRQAFAEKAALGQLADEYGVGAEQVDLEFIKRNSIAAAKVRAYRTVPAETPGKYATEEMQVSDQSGIDTPVFDEVINQQNQRLDFIEWGLWSETEPDA